MPVYKPHEFDIATYTLAFSVLLHLRCGAYLCLQILFTQQGKQQRSSRYGQVRRQSLQERTFHL